MSQQVTIWVNAKFVLPQGQTPERAIEQLRLSVADGQLHTTATLDRNPVQVAAVDLTSVVIEAE